MSDISRFKNAHANETMLIVCNGANLKLTPPYLFNYPSIGLNTIHLYKDWVPTYYTAVDVRLAQEFGDSILERFTDIPKIIPDRLSFWANQSKADHFYQFQMRPGFLWSPNDADNLWQDDIEKMTFSNIVHVAVKIAVFMGATKILIIGMEHAPDKGKSHFWGEDANGVNDVPLHEWFEGYKQLVEGAKMRNIEIVNLSPETHVPENIIPRANWKDYI